MLGAKASGAQNLTRKVKFYGVPIHDMDLQSHMTTSQVGSASQYTSNMQVFANLGVKAAVGRRRLGLSTLEGSLVPYILARLYHGRAGMGNSRELICLLQLVHSRILENNYGVRLTSTISRVEKKGLRSVQQRSVAQFPVCRLYWSQASMG